jgi:hypothetical protein
MRDTMEQSFELPLSWSWNTSPKEPQPRVRFRDLVALAKASHITGLV